MKFSLILVAILICDLTISEGAFVNLKIYEQEWIKKVVSDPLNNVNVRPTILNTSEPLEIAVSIFVKNFEQIDDQNMQFTMQVSLIQEWEDDRLAYGKYNPVQLRQMKYLTLLDLEKIWRPDTVFENEKDIEPRSVAKPNNYARIYPNGTVSLNSRLSVTLYCPLDLKYFPFDNPICSVKIESYAFTREDLIYKWKPVTAPIHVTNDISLTPQFVYKTVTSNYCDIQTSTGAYSCLVAEFHFERSRGFYLKHYYIPVVNLVIIGWLSFLLDINTDKTFLLRGLLCLTATSLGFIQLSSLRQSLPKTTYNTAFDIWSGISLTFLFVSLVEFIVVYFLSTHKFGTVSSGLGSARSGSIRRSNGTSQDDIEMSRTKVNIVDEQLIEPENFEVERRKSVQVQTHWTAKLVPEKIEKWTIILYPTLYCGFNFIYWIVVSNNGDSHYR